MIFISEKFKVLSLSTHFIRIFQFILDHKYYFILSNLIIPLIFLLKELIHYLNIILNKLNLVNIPPYYNIIYV